MTKGTRVGMAVAVGVTLALSLAQASSAPGPQGKKRPEVQLRADPLMSFAPAKVRFTAELKGGSNDYEEFYCPSIEWVWDDDTRSESTNDCEPYQAGQSEIRRRYTMEHVYRAPDTYRPEFRIKRKDKVIAAAVVQIEVQAGPTTGQ